MPVTPDSTYPYQGFSIPFMLIPEFTTYGTPEKPPQTTLPRYQGYLFNSEGVRDLPYAYGTTENNTISSNIIVAVEEAARDRNDTIFYTMPQTGAHNLFWSSSPKYASKPVTVGDEIRGFGYFGAGLTAWAESTWAAGYIGHPELQPDIPGPTSEYAKEHPAFMAGEVVPEIALFAWGATSVPSLVKDVSRASSSMLTRIINGKPQLINKEAMFQKMFATEPYYNELDVARMGKENLLWSQKVEGFRTASMDKELVKSPDLVFSDNPANPSHLTELIETKPPARITSPEWEAFNAQKRWASGGLNYQQALEEFTKVTPSPSLGSRADYLVFKQHDYSYLDFSSRQSASNRWASMLGVLPFASQRTEASARVIPVMDAGLDITLEQVPIQEQTPLMKSTTMQITRLIPRQTTTQITRQIPRLGFPEPTIQKFRPRLPFRLPPSSDLLDLKSGRGNKSEWTQYSNPFGLGVFATKGSMMKRIGKMVESDQL